MAFIDSLLNFVRNYLVVSTGALLGVLAFIGVFFRNALLYEYKRFRESGERDEDEVGWFEETATLARQVQRVWESKYVEPKSRGEAFSHDEVKGEMGLLADQLDRQASDVRANSVPPEIINLVYDTAQECRSAENCLTGIGNNPDFEEQGEEAVERAKELEQAASHRL